ncbi:NAD-dependent epimerase/dehydratase family protein [Pseudactinotalea terrae]|uniref:polysaccharide biosynthesis C-terminal domain-containing protein n=1 Tax=Pseudactinotalea terrae TaxID=1743262 RepID=UPI0012E25C8F|nr:NAD-dependent epimerase/dehydratase family protein [Pseudactinotalea terrae]
MTVVITGGYGFLGWHLSARLLAQTSKVPIRVGRTELMDKVRLRAIVEQADVIYHLAGVNRASNPREVEEGNLRLARVLGQAILARNKPVRLVYANSIQALDGNPYGRGKAGAAEILRHATTAVGGVMADVLLPNLFGEHGRPEYNSFVATFAHSIVNGTEPVVIADREIPLLHAQSAAQALIEAANEPVDIRHQPGGSPRLVSEVLAQLVDFERLYKHGEVPELTDQFTIDLFNTYRSYTFPERFPLYPRVHTDSRGILFESLRYHGGEAQTYVSTTRPGQIRGEHYHVHKFERFVVVRGTAEINLRRLLDDRVITFRVSGNKPAIIDMPTMWIHNLRNVGSDELVTHFFSSQLLDQAAPDQYFAEVQPEERSA